MGILPIFFSYKKVAYLGNLNELFIETMRLNTKWSSVESLLSMLKNPLRTNWKASPGL